jgi:DNA-binding transcriptional LysR family regulator
VKTANLDLNLLVALAALLEERHVTRAAQRVRVSQPAMSESLGRLRRHYKDDLLTRVGNHYELTPLALSLREVASSALEMVNRTFDAESGFDPATSDREFVVYASDYLVTVLGPVLTRLFGDAAPHARLRLPAIHPSEADEPTDNPLRRADGIVMPRGFLAGLPGVDLFRDEWVVVTAQSSERIGARLTVEAMGRLPWLVMDGVEGPAMRALRSMGQEPRVDLVVGTLLPTPFLIEETDRIAVLPRRLAERFSVVARVRVLPLPYDIGPLVETLWWHPVHNTDPGHVWLRTIMQKAGSEIC